MAKRFGRIDVLANIAGGSAYVKRIEELTWAEWKEVIDANLKGTFLMCRETAPIMQRQKSGVIINISTFAAFEPDQAFPTSSVFRAGLASYAKLFADRYAADNIRMNNILPGFIDTFPEQQAIRDRIPMKRYGKTSEISALIAFLASDAAGYITGQDLRVDGGITRSV